MSLKFDLFYRNYFTPRNHKLFYFSLEILVRTPLVKQLDPSKTAHAVTVPMV